MTSVEPLATMPISPAEQPVTWNSGMTPSETRGAGSGGISPRRRWLRAAVKALDRMLVTMLRCVPNAPLGAPVVPLV